MDGTEIAEVMVGVPAIGITWGVELSWVIGVKSKSGKASRTVNRSPQLFSVPASPAVSSEMVSVHVPSPAPRNKDPNNAANEKPSSGVSGEAMMLFMYWWSVTMPSLKPVG